MKRFHKAKYNCILLWVKSLACSHQKHHFWFGMRICQMVYQFKLQIKRFVISHKAYKFCETKFNTNNFTLQYSHCSKFVNLSQTLYETKLRSLLWPPNQSLCYIFYEDNNCFYNNSFFLFFELEHRV